MKKQITFNTCAIFLIVLVSQSSLIPVNGQWMRDVIHQNLNLTSSFDAGDIDGDGDNDISACLFGNKKVVWYEFDSLDWTMHIIDNAFKFAPPMTTIRINLERNGDGGFILLVRDYGTGIPKELREKVFDSFFQIETGDTRAYNGLGVGLTIARSFARAMGGNVEIVDASQGCSVRMVVAPGPLIYSG